MTMWQSSKRQLAVHGWGNTKAQNELIQIDDGRWPAVPWSGYAWFYQEEARVAPELPTEVGIVFIDMLTQWKIATIALHK